MIIYVDLDVLFGKVPFASGNQNEVVVEPATCLEDLIPIITLIDIVSLQIVEVFFEGNLIVHISIHFRPDFHHVIVVLLLFFCELFLEAKAQQTAFPEVSKHFSVLLNRLNFFFLLQKLLLTGSNSSQD